MKLEIKDRLKQIRDLSELTQDEFGKRINIQSRAHISALENGSRNITDRIITDVCREFGVNEKWLRTGEGEMRSENEDNFIQTIVNSLGSVDEKDMEIIKIYLSLDEEYRTAFRTFLSEFKKNAK